MNTSTEYTKPFNIPNDMGGGGNDLDDRMIKILELLKYAPLALIYSMLDIGFGKGQLATFLASKGKNVTATGLAVNSYGANIEQLQMRGIKIIESPVEEMPFANNSFDAVIISHVLEHCPNVGLALREIHRVLKNDGWIFVFVPPHEDYVCAGHISIGWNLGQLMYVLLLNGFDIKNGMFAEYGYNVCGFAKKNENLVLPSLRFDRGDIQILKEYFPITIPAKGGISDGFNGKIKVVNFPEGFTSKLLVLC